MEKWEKHYNEQKGIYEIYPTKACNPRVCAVMNQTEEESIANLIAAAPDLLAACKIGLSYVNAVITGVPRPIVDREDDKQTIEQAIDKAGKSVK